MPDADDGARFLLPHHRKMIDDSQITSSQVEAGRGYRSIEDPIELEEMGFEGEQIRVPCLYVPCWSITGEVCHFIRPDEPRLVNGKPVKYDRPKGSRNFIDVNPAMPREWLTNYSAKLWLEGQKKVDCALSDGKTALGLMGVWGWLRRIGRDRGTHPLPDLRHITYASVVHYIMFDSDLWQKPEVYQAAIEFGFELESRGAVVKYGKWDNGPGGEKIGIDDLHRVGLTIDDVIRTAVDEPEEPERARKWIVKEDFWAHGPSNKYIYSPTGDLWVPESVNKRVRAVPIGGSATQRPTEWLSQRRSVQQTTWAPGEPEIIEDRLIGVNGWFEKQGARVYNYYRAPTTEGGDPTKAGRWLDHVKMVYPDDWEHVVAWLAQRVQRPGVKINHALVLGGRSGIGKDTILEPVIYAVGSQNVKEASPRQIAGRFNSFIRAVILRVNEAHDVGDEYKARYAFYDQMKTYIASPPEFLTYEAKFRDPEMIPNVVGVVYTTNYRTDGVYLEEDDRRHYMTWSPISSADVPGGPEYFDSIYRWFDDGGREHVAALLRGWDLSRFDPKAPPPKTEAWWDVVNAGRAPEESELAGLIEELGSPDAITLRQLVKKANEMLQQYGIMTGANGNLAGWLLERKNQRVIPHKMEAAGYVAVRNPEAKDGRWKVGSDRVVIYARGSLTPPQARHAALELQQSNGQAS